jgi:rubredoxin
MTGQPILWWKCTECGYLFQAAQAPERCPNCRETCTFLDVTCYTPDCGGPESGNFDPRLAGQSSGTRR